MPPTQKGPVRGAPGRVDHALLLAAALALVGCSASAPERPAPQQRSVRAGLLSAIDALDPAQPLAVRYNPAPCACPPFEVALGHRWVRARWPSLRDERWRSLSVRLAATSASDWPVSLTVVGRVERELRRTRGGVYAVTLDVAEVRSAGRGDAQRSERPSAGEGSQDDRSRPAPTRPPNS